MNIHESDEKDEGKTLRTTFHQKPKSFKPALKISQQDRAFVNGLRDRAADFLSMTEDQRNIALYPERFRVKTPKRKKLLALPGALRKRSSMDQLSSVDVTQERDPDAFKPCDGTQHPHALSDDEVVTGMKKANIGHTLLQYFEGSVATKVSTIVQEQVRADAYKKLYNKSIFLGLNSQNVLQRKRLLIRRLNEIRSSKQQKEEKLAGLKLQLQKLRQFREKEVQQQDCVDGRMEVWDAAERSPNRIFMQSTTDTLMDIKALKSHFDFSDLGSVYEKKMALVRKLAVTSQRLKEAEYSNQSYAKMLTQMERQHLHETKQSLDLHQQKQEIISTVDEIKHVNLIENQRIISIENLQFDYHSQLEIHRHKMELLLQEKNVTLHNCEEDTKTSILQMMERIRCIRTYRAICEEAVKIKELATENEKLIVKQFEKRQTEVEVIKNLALLSLMRKYTNDLHMIKTTPDISEDDVRVKGLELVLEVQQEIKSIIKPYILDSESFGQ